MVDCHRFTICRPEYTRVFHISQRFQLGSVLSIIVVSVMYLGLSFSSLLRGDVQKSPSVTMDVSNSSSSLAQADLAISMSTLEQQKAQQEMEYSHCHIQSSLLTELHLLDCAIHVARQNNQNRQASGDIEPHLRVAFLFVARGEIPHEPLWRRYFSGHEKLYSLYTHNDPSFQYSTSSLFYGHQVPSQGLSRLSISLVNAMRRLLSYALLDPKQGATNSWFVFVCESTIPIRSFSYTYEYLSKSQHSFVESFYPVSSYLQWTTEPYFNREDMRKGEMWMALEHRHAIMVLEDWKIYYKFKSGCNWFCGPDEQYIQTLLALKDPYGIANRTLMYVDWSHIHTSSPYTFDVGDMKSEWFQDIQDRVMDKDGMYHDTSFEAKETNITSRSCYYNGVPDSPCFFFARKVASNATKYLENLPTTVLGY